MRPALEGLRPIVPPMKGWSNLFGLSEAAANAIRNAFRYDFDPAPNKISVTEFNDPPRLSILKRRYGSIVKRDVSEMVAPFIGICVHQEIERQAPDGTFTEERLEMPMARVRGIDWVLRGKSDLVEVDADGRRVKIRDIKVTNVWKAIHEGFDDWEAQLNLYAALWRHAGFEPYELWVEMFLTGWKRSEWRRKKPGEYPSVAYRLVQMPIWSDARVLAYMVNQLETFADLYDRPDDELTVCPSDQRWIQKGKYALMKKGRKSALKNEETQNELLEWAVRKEHATRDGSKVTLNPNLYIEGRPGEETRCISAHPRYCPVREKCSYARERGYLDLERGVTENDDKSPASEK